MLLLLILACVACGGGLNADGDKPAAEFDAFLASLPDKTDNEMTVSHGFRRDLRRMCEGENLLGICPELVAVEVGCYHGQTTALLSRLFRQVFVIDNSRDNIAKAKLLNRDRSNIVYLLVENYSGTHRFEWCTMLGANNIDVAFVDASHFYEHVVSDINCALSLQSINTIVFDDYGLIRPVQAAVDKFVSSGHLSCHPLGEHMSELLKVAKIAEAGRWWSRNFGESSAKLSEETQEGQVCQVLGRDHLTEWHQAILGLDFACYRPSPGGLQLAFNMKLEADVICIRWPGEEKESRIPWELSVAHRLMLHADAAAEVAQEFVFDERLRRGLFVREGQPEQLCIPSGDVNRLYMWTIEDIHNFEASQLEA